VNPHDFAISQLRQQVSRDDIIRGLMRQGLDAPSAMRIFAEAQTAQKTNASPLPPPPRVPSQAVRLPHTESRMNGNILYGIIIAAIGVILTVGGYIMAASKPTGGHYYIFWGLIVVGVIRIIRGLMQ
jgi:hypothetical protein